MGAGKSVNGREKNLAEEKFFLPPITAPGSRRMAWHDRGKQFADSDLVDFFSGSTDSAISFSGSTDLHTPIHPPPYGSMIVYTSITGYLKKNVKDFPWCRRFIYRNTLKGTV